MTLEELDVALEELEVRLERLRALYEQYFLGFEKVEPSVARKDVDRRIYVLRREKIRNTGKRFKLQTLIQRYNTFQQYWQRICREIENGTYRRLMARAERRMGAENILTIAAKRRFGKAAARDSIDEDAITEHPVDELLPADEEEITQVGLGPPSPSEAPPPPQRRPATRRPPPRGRSSRPGPRFESLELDMDFLSDWDPLRARPKPKSSPKAAPPPEPPPRQTPPQRLPPSFRVAPGRSLPPPKPARKSLPPAARERPAPPPRASRPSAPPKAAPKAPPGRLTDDRIRELHGRLAEMKEKNREAGNVSMERLAKTLRATEEKLRAEHKNRRIEFEVVIRDGKAVVKPTVR